MLAPENPRLAGYILTGNRFIFSETDGSFAWLYHCPNVHSPLHPMNQYFDRIPILYEGEIRFFDLITWQTYPDAVTQNCSGWTKHLFELDMDQENPWYTLTPRMVHQDKLSLFGPEMSYQWQHSLSLDYRMQACYRRSELCGYRDNIINNSASRTASKKFSQNLIVYSTPQKGSDGFHYYTPGTEFSLDKMVSPEYFKDSFMHTFRPVAYILHHCETYSFVFLFLKLILDMIVIIVKHIKINRTASDSLVFGKTLLSAS